MAVEQRNVMRLVQAGRLNEFMAKASRQAALPINQMQSNKLPNKSIKYAENLISNQTNTKSRI
jgi:hypothetical protein